MLLSWSLHFMHYPLPLLLHSDFTFSSDLIHNLSYFHNFHSPNYNSNFHNLVLDHSHLHFMLSYYTRFRLHSLLLRLALSYLYSSLHYLYNSSYFTPDRLSLHYMFIHYLLYYMFIIMLIFIVIHLYCSPMSHLHFMSYNYSMLDYMSMFHMLALLYLYSSMSLLHSS